MFCDPFSSALNSGWTVLMVCAENQSPAMAKALVEHGASVNTSMDSGWTSMHAAAKVGSAEIVKLLLDHGGDKNILAKHREFGSNLAVEDVTTNQNILELLAEKK